jgi:DNA-binding MarR family transcriptional regulator
MIRVQLIRHLTIPASPISMRAVGHRQSDVAQPSEMTCSLFRPADLTFLLHAAADRMAAELDRAALEMGLNDVRDWLVLAVLDDGQQRTQLELSRLVCVDKTTLISVLDRLERQELIVRTVDPADRRVRIPQITAAGRRTYAKFATARDTAEARALDGVDAEQRTVLFDLLSRIADPQAAAQPAI